MQARPKILVILVFSLLCLSVIFAYGQTNNLKYLTSQQSALGSNTTVLSGIYGVFGNPGAISVSEANLSLIANSEQRFFLGSLNSTSIAGIKRIGSYDHVGLSFGSFGIDEYQERRITLSYSRKIAANTSLGVTSNFYQKEIEEYGSESDFDFSLGIHSKVSEKVSIGIAAFNVFSEPSQGYLRQNTEIAIGILYDLSDKVNWIIELKSDFTDTTVFSTGIAYQIIQPLNLQIGMNTLDNGVALGIRYNFNSKVKVHGSMRSNQNLGVSPGLSILFEN